MEQVFLDPTAVLCALESYAREQFNSIQPPASLSRACVGSVMEKFKCFTRQKIQHLFLHNKHEFLLSIQLHSTFHVQLFSLFSHNFLLLYKRFCGAENDADIPREQINCRFISLRLLRWLSCLTLGDTSRGI